MPKKHDEILLGDEIEDVTLKIRGIVIARLEHLDGSLSWLMQPPCSSDGGYVQSIEVRAAYVKKVGDGVYVEPKPPLGFNAARRSR